MILEKITEKEIKFMSCWHNPICQAECLFSDFDDLGQFDSEKLSEIRLYQLSFMSYEPLIDTNIPELDEKEKFKLRKGSSDLLNVGARKYGKSLITLKLDIALSILYDKNLWAAYYSIDEKRIRGVLDPVKLACEFHPIIKNWQVKCSYKPEIKFYGRKTNWRLQGVNMTLKGKSPGEQWYQLHVHKVWGDEVSFETESIANKRKEALSELGAIFRLAGMTNFTKHSPVGKMFFDMREENKLVNLPQYVNPYWDKKEKEDRMKAYGGEDTLNFKVFVKGEIVEDGVSEFDIERVTQCYKKNKNIKKFEISKEKYSHFKDLIVVERPKNADRIFISSDVGDNQTEIIVHSEVENKYSYLYNIVLYNLTEPEQLEVFKYLINTINANVVAIDCGDAFGRILCDHLESIYSADNIVRYAGASKINVGFEIDDAGKIVMKKGKPVYKQEYMSEWSIQRLKVLLYENKCIIPMDYKFDKQINSMISTMSGTRKVYACLQEDDHEISAWRVFAIAQWVKKDFNQTKTMSKEWGTGVMG